MFEEGNAQNTSFWITRVAKINISTLSWLIVLHKLVVKFYTTVNWEKFLKKLAEDYSLKHQFSIHYGVKFNYLYCTTVSKETPMQHSIYDI